ncbi:DMT family transporter [Phytomonospora endophytica]|uniref:Drug/metabolite transporter (DMT)-like permease n=1 Tax=Phytomonospora endophytica TaxID=714109 RepID=A0A841FVS2_9ACTN|nr:EamA family transporter [Phytomonospora endophytica]MBB6039884.1 drug/metabolite transporter (DMT)-like permease [Phytomonospora endophytica]GIG71046.1 hypothetical protein Pen01_73410 [Phytomonospora endophytica]
MTPARRKALLVPLLSGVFVVLWTSGFIAGPIGVDAAPPLALTFWRFALAATILTAVALATKAPWPRGRAAWTQLVLTGLLMQAMMFGFAYLALDAGVSAGLAALISGASPVMIALGGTLALKEKLSPLQWVGTLLGFVGIAVAVTGELDGTGLGLGVLFALIGTAGFAAGTLVQRRFGVTMDLRTGPAVQLAAAALAVAPVAAVKDGLAIPLTMPSLGALAWLALGNSVLAFGVMFFLLRHRTAADTARMMLLVPPLTAVVAWPLLGQPTDVYIWAGLVITGAGVAIASRRVRRRETVGVAVAEPEPEPALSPLR